MTFSLLGLKNLQNMEEKTKAVKKVLFFILIFLFVKESSDPRCC